MKKITKTTTEKKSKTSQVEQGTCKGTLHHHKMTIIFIQEKKEKKTKKKKTKK